MSKLVFSVLVVLLLATTALATKDWWVYDTNIDSYSGQIARDRRIFDPYTRDRYFGTDYQRQYVNFGMKGPTDRMMKTGFKSAFSGKFNLDTNAFTQYGRVPGHISNWDPNIRGWAKTDVSVDLLPPEAISKSIGPKDVLTKGTARVISLGNSYGATLTSPGPNTQIFVTTVNLPPVNENEVYEVWLFDYDSEYPLSIGLLQPGAGITAELLFEFTRKIDMFDALAVTSEPYPDYDPMPGEIVLWGNFNVRNVVNPLGSQYEERLR